jgi:hypothetical protein
MTKVVTIEAQQKWECIFETRKTETSLLRSVNELGQQGWELVQVLYYKDLKGVMTWTAFLKRPWIGGHSTTEGGSAIMGRAGERPPSNEPQGFDLSGEEFQVKEE